IDLTERIVRGRGRGGVRLRKLHAIEKVKRFGPELEASPLADGRPLRQREVVIVDVIPSQFGIGPSGITEFERVRDGEAGRIEPSIQSRLGPAADLLFAAGSDIRPQSGIEARQIRTRRESQRESRLKRRASVDAPAADDFAGGTSDGIQVPAAVT